MAIAIAKAESGLRCEAVNVNRGGSVDKGVFQLNSVHTAKGNLDDCLEGIKIAKVIYDRQGWSPWVAYTNKSYKRFLTN